MSSSLLLLIGACILVLTPIPIDTIHPGDLPNGTILENFGAHCVPIPPGLQTICSMDIGWSTRMRLPNLLGHKSYEELNNEIASMAILQAENLAKVDCKSLEQLKLVLCATIAPPCFDVVLPPCRQACLRARSGCRPSLQRNAIEWPKILDCRQFPATPEICIARMLPLISRNPNEALTRVSDVSESSILRKTKHRASGSSKRRRKLKKERKTNATTTTIAPTAPEVELATVKEPSSISEKLPIEAINRLNSRNTTSNDILADDKSLTMPSSTSAPTSPMAETRTTTTTAATTFSTTARPTTASAAFETTTTATVETTTTIAANSSSAPLSDMAPFSPISASANRDTKTGPVGMKADQPEGTGASTLITRGLTSFLCASSPEWLIKTKLTDSQLMAATKKRKLRIRSYRQIFGTFVNSTTSGIRATNSSSVSRAARSKSVVATSGIYLSLSNATSFIYPLGSSLHCQLMSNESSQESQHSDESSSASSGERSQSKTYLVFGTNSNGIKTASYIVLWPGSKLSKDFEAQASDDIVKTYRDFKLRQLAACQQTDRVVQRSRLSQGREDSLGRVVNKSQEMTTTTVMSSTETSTGSLMRAQKKKRKEQQQRA